MYISYIIHIQYLITTLQSSRVSGIMQLSNMIAIRTCVFVTLFACNYEIAFFSFKMHVYITA